MRLFAGDFAGKNHYMGLTGRTGQQDASRIGGRYRLVEKLGIGGMAEVWRGYDEVLGRQVAVKVLSPHLAGNDTFRDRLRHEALAAARLCHPHITGIFDFGDQLAVPFVVMELNDGESVSARLDRSGPLPWRDAVVIAAEVASALAAAHALGVVHRDITPANVMLTVAGAKVVDFGISALIGQRDAAPDGSLLGTPAYLAPERLSGGRVGPATDVYALGLLLYRSLTARMPWTAENTAEALRAHLYADPEPLPALPGLPAEVADLCLRCLAKKPEDRPAAGQVATILAGALGRTPMTPVGGSAPVPPTWHPASASARLGRPRGVRRLRAALRIGVALRVGGVRALGGGVFVGSHYARDVLTGGRIGRALVAGRHRTQAVVATLSALAMVGLAWSTTRGPAEVRPAQAAGAGAAAAIPRGAECQVRYQVRVDAGSDFEALVTISNIGVRALSGWRLEFAYPGTQRLTAAPKRVTQTGRKVVVAGKVDGTLRPGRSVTVTLRGEYRVADPLPLAFAMNGHACRAVVIGATVDHAPFPVAEASTSNNGG